jgi:hypothetical protein
MNLQDFVSETLVQLVEGIRDAQSRLSPLGAKVNPAGFRVLPERFNVPVYLPVQRN